jgi:hypothetical protein
MNTNSAGNDSGCKTCIETLPMDLGEGQLTARVFLWQNAPGRHSEGLSQKDGSRNSVPGPFFHGIGFTRLGESCYPTALLSNKLVYFVQFLKEKLNPSLRPNFGHCMLSGTHFFRKIAPVKTNIHHLPVTFRSALTILRVSTTRLQFFFQKTLFNTHHC